MKNENTHKSMKNGSKPFGGREIVLKKEDTKKVETNGAVEQLKIVLADTFVLYMKTYAVHWNFKGAKFFSVHKMTESQYEELAEAVDQIAERIRALGGEAPISLSSILGASHLSEFQAHAAGTDIAISELADGNILLAKKAKEAAVQMDKEGDIFSNDMMVGRVGAHEKAAWMLRSFLES